MKTTWLLLIMALLIGAHGTVALAGEATTNGWQTYLSAKERAKLLVMKPLMLAEKNSLASIPEGEAFLVALPFIRQVFVASMVEAAPALTEVKSTAYDAEGINGLWLTPAGADPEKVLLYFHGGGYVFGSPESGEAIAGYLAKKAGITCFSLNYPLAPESPWPAAVDNAVAAYRMLLAKGIKPGNIAMAGDSAGGGLTVATLLRLRDLDLPQPAGAYLLSPWLNLARGNDSKENPADLDPILDLRFLKVMADLYVKGNDPKNPSISPVYAEVSGLPPLLIQAGSHEILLDDSLTLAQNAALADVPVRLSVWPGYFHVFQMFHAELEGARRALDDGAKFIRESMAGSLMQPE